MKLQNSENNTLKSNLINDKVIQHDRGAFNKKNYNDNIQKGPRYNNNYDENEYAIGQFSKNNCNPDSFVKVKKTQPIEKIDFGLSDNSSQVELFNKQLANMQKDIMVNSLKQNKLTMGTKIMMENERVHALEAIETGIYVTWCSKDVKLIIINYLNLIIYIL